MKIYQPPSLDGVFVLMRRMTESRQAHYNECSSVGLVYSSPTGRRHIRPLVCPYHEYRHPLAPTSRFLLPRHVDARRRGGAKPDVGGSRDACREAFAAGIIEDGEVWMEMIKSRNQSTHAFDSAFYRNARGPNYPGMVSLKINGVAIFSLDRFGYSKLYHFFFFTDFSLEPFLFFSGFAVAAALFDKGTRL
jgi:hypothetical protein